MNLHRSIPQRAARRLSIRITGLVIAIGACGGDRGEPVGPEEPGTVASAIRILPCACHPDNTAARHYRSEPSAERTIGVLGTELRISALALTGKDSVLYSAGDRFSWSSSAPAVATVEAKPGPYGGIWVSVTAVSEGTATITATSEGLTGEMTVTVRDRARLAWSVPIEGLLPVTGPAVGPDGTVYVTERWSLIAVSPRGAILWTMASTVPLEAAPAIGEDGTLYIGARTNASNGRLTAVAPDGTVLWVLQGIDGIRGSPAIGADGTLYAVGFYHVYAVDPLGGILWTYDKNTDRAFLSSPALAADGTIYIGDADGLLHAIKPDGTLRWTFRARDSIRSSPAVGTDGTIYFGAYDGRLHAVDPDGTERWTLQLRDSGAIFGSPSIGPDGTIYVGAHGIFAVSPDGSLRWSSRVIGTHATPVVGADGTLYVTGSGPSGEPVIAALDSQGRPLWDHHVRRHAHGTPAIGVNGTIYGTSYLNPDGGLYAIVEKRPANGGFTDAHWPVLRGNRANTGRGNR